MTSSHTRYLSTALGAVALSLAALACTPQLDGKTVESTIKDECAKNALTLSSTTCPATIKAQSGATFSCTSSTSDGDAITWEVTQKDNAGHFEFKSPAVMDQKKLGDDVEPQLTASAGGPIDSKCPAKWMVARPGAKFTCDASVSGKAVSVDCVFGEGTKYSCHMH